MEILSDLGWSYEKLIREHKHEESLSFESFRQSVHIRVSHRSTVIQTKFYAPSVFASIRARHGVSEAVFVNALKDLHGANILISGQSGASLCSTNRERFVVKTLTKKEKGKLIRFLSTYYIHTSGDSRGSESILSDFFGLVRIRCAGRSTYACVLNNLIIGNLSWDGCPSTLDKKSLVFDMKGSSVGRINRQPARPMPFVLLKDLNIVSITPKYKKDLEILHRMIEQDTSFLASHQMMDYSLLVCVCYVSREEEDDIECMFDMHGSVVFPLHSIEYMMDGHRFTREEHSDRALLASVGIIDFLQDYSMKKKAARVFKTLVLRKKGSKISTMSPRKYRDRFIRFSRSVIRIREMSTEYS